MVVNWKTVVGAFSHIMSSDLQLEYDIVMHMVMYDLVVCGLSAVR